MKLPGLVSFRLCTLSDKELAEAVAARLNSMYKEPVSVPYRSLPARPNEDFDLIVGELIVRFLERVEADTLKCEFNCGDNYCDENGCVERKRILTPPKAPEKE